MGTAKHCSLTGPRAGADKRRSGRASPGGGAAAGASLPERRALPPSLLPGSGARSVADSSPSPRPAPDQPPHKPWWTLGSSSAFHSPFWLSAQVWVLYFAVVAVFEALQISLTVFEPEGPPGPRPPGQSLEPSPQQWSFSCHLITQSERIKKSVYCGSSGASAGGISEPVVCTLQRRETSLLASVPTC